MPSGIKSEMELVGSLLVRHVCFVVYVDDLHLGGPEVQVCQHTDLQ